LMYPSAAKLLEMTKAKNHYCKVKTQTFRKTWVKFKSWKESSTTRCQWYKNSII